ncbi:MAG: hypothetical protein NZO16_00380, partial [Deltaproteobacteria bacterium]|nr:hypothetical protein [Deltaproteobacteria bacterium]
FSNYKIPDNCARVARRSYHKLQSLLLPAIRTCLNSNLRPRHLLLNIALLCHLSRTNKLDSHISSINELKETLSDEDSELINILEKELSFLLDTVLLKGVDDAIKECQSLAA